MNSSKKNAPEDLIESLLGEGRLESAMEGMYSLLRREVGNGLKLYRTAQWEKSEWNFRGASTQ